jgi:hypothetical protein
MSEKPNLENLREPAKNAQPTQSNPFQDLGGKQISAPVSDVSTQPIKVDDLYGPQGGKVLDAPSLEPEAPEVNAEPTEETGE